MAAFRETSCGVAYAHGEADYNGHYGIRELCDICPLSQLKLCKGAWRTPGMAVVEEQAAPSVPSARFSSPSGPSSWRALNEPPRYFLQHTHGFQIHDKDKPTATGDMAVPRSAGAPPTEQRRTLMEFRTWPPLLVVDVEGNGAAPLPDLVEVATVPVAEGRADSDRSRIWLIRPQRPITRFATSVHGITNEAVADAKPWSELGPQIQAELDGVWIAAHNAASMWCSAGPQAAPRRQVLARSAAGEAA